MIYPSIYSNILLVIFWKKKEKGVKCIISLFIVFCKADNEEEITNPPVVLKSDVFVCLNGTNINERLNVACEQIKERFDEFVRNGSGWVIILNKWTLDYSSMILLERHHTFNFLKNW